MKTLNISTFLCLSMILLLAGCSESSSSGGGGGTTPDATYVCNSTPMAKGSRKFGMDILAEPSVGGYSDNLSSLKAIGGEFQTLHMAWKDIEGAGSGATSGTFTDPYGALAALDAIAASDGIKVTLRIHPVDIPGKLVPTDLMSTRFNSANLKTRAQAMLNFVFTKIDPNHVSHLMMGNEVDDFDPESDTDFWLDYPDFLFDMNVWLATNYPGIDIGFVSTLKGVTDQTKILAHASNQKSVDVLTGWLGVVDILGVTYYPTEASFLMQSNSHVATDFQNLIGFTNKPIHLEEVGYASSKTVSGSEYLQAEFICEVLKSWDTYAAEIPTLAVLRMVDLSSASASDVADTYNLSGNNYFIEFIRSLGVKTSTGTAKQSFTLLSSELDKRGF